MAGDEHHGLGFAQMGELLHHHHEIGRHEQGDGRVADEVAGQIEPELL